MKPIFIAASPNTKFKDVWAAKKQLLQPWGWNSRKPVTKFEEKIKNFFNVRNAIAVDSGRSSFYLTLKAMGIGEGDEVLVPAFTCVVIVNPILWLKAKPIFVDINKENYNIDLRDLEKKITKKTKAILVQHTFGIPVEMENVKRFAKEYNLKIIEDCAHTIGGTYANKMLGTYGDAAILTFGIEKVISTVRGGMIITNDDGLAEKIKGAVQNLPKYSLWKVFISLLNPIIWYIAKPLYYVGIGKVTIGRGIIALTRFMSATGNMISKEEYVGDKPKWIPAQMPGALANLGFEQLKSLNEYNSHRQRVERFYREKFRSIDNDNIININPPTTHGTVLLRYPILVKDPEKIYLKAKADHIILGNWYERMFYIPEENLKYIGYKKGMCPNAEWVAEHIVNLPMYWGVGDEEVSKIVSLFTNS